MNRFVIIKSENNYEKCKEKVKQYIDLVGTNVKLIGGKNE